MLIYTIVMLWDVEERKNQVLFQTPDFFVQRCIGIHTGWLLCWFVWASPLNQLFRMNFLNSKIHANWCPNLCAKPPNICKPKRVPSESFIETGPALYMGHPLLSHNKPRTPGIPGLTLGAPSRFNFTLRLGFLSFLMSTCLAVIVARLAEHLLHKTNLHFPLHI